MVPYWLTSSAVWFRMWHMVLSETRYVNAVVNKVVHSMVLNMAQARKLWVCLESRANGVSKYGNCYVDTSWCQIRCEMQSMPFRPHQISINMCPLINSDELQTMLKRSRHCYHGIMRPSIAKFACSHARHNEIMRCRNSRLYDCRSRWN